MTNKISLLILSAASLVLVGAGCLSPVANQNAGAPAPASQPQTAPIPAANSNKGWVGYEVTPGGYRFDYPPSFFNFSESEGGMVALTSQYYITENYKGTPDGEYKHYFSLKFDPRQSPLSTALDQPIASYQKIKTNGGLTAYTLTTGLEGTNYRYYYLPRDTRNTLVVTVSYFTDFLKDNVLPAPLPEVDELAIAQKIVDSIGWLGGASVVPPSSTEPINYSAYTNSKYNYTLQYPENHLVFSGFDSNAKPISVSDFSDTVVVSDLPTTGDVSARSYTAVIINHYGNLSDQNWIDQNLGDYIAPEDIMGNKIITFAGRTAHEILGRSDAESAYRIVLVPLDYDVLVIIQNLNLPWLNQVMDSFRFTN